MNDFLEKVWYNWTHARFVQTLGQTTFAVICVSAVIGILALASASSTIAYTDVSCTIGTAAVFGDDDRVGVPVSCNLPSGRVTQSHIVRGQILLDAINQRPTTALCTITLDNSVRSCRL